MGSFCCLQRLPTNCFTAQVIILNYESQISADYVPLLDCHISHILHLFVGLKEKIFYPGKKLEAGSKFLKSDDATIADVVIGKARCAVNLAFTE